MRIDMTEKEKILLGELYTASDEELRRDFLNAKRILGMFRYFPKK